MQWPWNQSFQTGLERGGVRHWGQGPGWGVMPEGGTITRGEVMPVG